MGSSLGHDRMVAIAAGEVTLHDQRTRRRWTVEVAPYALGAVPITQARYAEITGQSRAQHVAAMYPLSACRGWTRSVSVTPCRSARD